MICPRCKLNELNLEIALNSLSRRDNKTYVCNDCGTEESLIDIGKTQPDEREKAFVAFLERQKTATPEPPAQDQLDAGSEAESGSETDAPVDGNGIS